MEMRRLTELVDWVASWIAGDHLFYLLNVFVVQHNFSVLFKIGSWAAFGVHTLRIIFVFGVLGASVDVFLGLTMLLLEEFQFSVQKLDIDHSARTSVDLSFSFEDERRRRLNAAASFGKGRIEIRVLDVVICKWILDLIDSLQFLLIFSKVIPLTLFPINPQWFFYCGTMRITLVSLFRYSLPLQFAEPFVGRPICPVDNVIGLLAKVAEIILGFKLLLKH